MRYLIVSDIHANLEGLRAVLAANKGLYDQILCCGDFVDYCASPNEVCDWARENCEVVIRGNHDKACCGLDDTDDYNPLAQAAVKWTMGSTKVFAKGKAVVVVTKPTTHNGDSPNIIGAQAAPSQTTVLAMP